MIDPKAFREDPKRFRAGAADKGVAIDFDRLTALDERRRAILTEMEAKKAEQNRLSKEVGPKMGQIKGKLKSAQGAEKDSKLRTPLSMT
jgi:seryl-tRNA synthetase